MLAAALEADAVVIPFGGGTNISGSLDAPAGEQRPVLSVDLGRLRPRARDRRGVAPRARAGGRLRAGARGAAQRVRLDARALPRQLHALDARRLDRDALVGHAVRQVRRRGRPDARPARRHAGGHRRAAPRADHVDRPERARDAARQRGAARDHHRGDGARAPAAGGARDPRLPAPRLGARPRGDARDRGERGDAVGHARLRRPRDAVLVRDAQGRLAGRPAEVARAAGRA